MIEAAYLVEAGKIKVVYSNREIGLSELYEWGRERIKRFPELYAVFKDLRSRGFVVRRGLKFGCDYLAYRLGPGIDHAPFGVQVYRGCEEIDPIELVRMGRLLHSVRKKLIVAVVEEGGVQYYAFDWWKP